MTWQESVNLYDEIVAKSTRFKRKGKTVPYTSANGHMFSFINKDGEFGIRFSKEIQDEYMTTFDTTLFKSHGATMKGYFLITEKMLKDLNLISRLLEESYDFVMSLKPK